MNDWIEDHFGLVCVLAFILIIGVVVAAAMAAERTGCASRATLMELKFSWGPFQGCMVRHDGRWDPLDQYIVMREWHI